MRRSFCKDLMTNAGGGGSHGDVSSCGENVNAAPERSRLLLRESREAFWTPQTHPEPSWSPVATRAAAQTTLPSSGPKCKSGPVDLVFLIDGSRSVRPHEFETMRKFMVDILKTLDIGLNATRVGVVQYSSQVRSGLNTAGWLCCCHSNQRPLPVCRCAASSP